MRNQQAHQQQIQNSDWAPEMKELFHQLFLPEDNGKQVDIKSYVGVIWRHKWLVLLTLAIIPALVAYFVLLEEPRYEATTELLIESSNQKVVQFEEVVQPDESFAYLNTKFSFLRSRTLAEKVIDSLHVTSNGVEPGAPSVPEESNELLRESQTSVETASNTPEIESGFEAEESEFDDAMGDVQDIVTGAISYVRQSIIANRHKPKFDQAELDRNDKVVGLMRRTRVEPVDGTRLVRVTISGSNPYEITDQVNTLAKIFVAQNLEYKLEASKTASAWLKREVADLKETMRNTELLLLDFIKEREYTPRDEYSQNSEDKVESDSSIESMLKNTYIKRVELESRIEELRRFLKVLPQRPQLITSDLNISSVREMQQKYIETKEQIETVSEQFKFKSQHPRIKILSERLSRLENNIKLGIQSEIERINLVKETLTKTEESFDKAISEEQENRLKFDRDSIEYNNLKRDIANKRELFESMVRRLNETEVTKGLETNNVKIAQKAIVPVNPISSKKKVKLAGSFVAALVLGTGFAIFFESLSKRFRSPEDVEDYIKIPFLGVIPHQIRKIRSQSELFGLLDAYSDFANAYRELRTNISLQSAHRSMGSIMVSSASRGEGKSTVAAYLGISFAQLGKSVLLIDANLRSPALHYLFGLDNGIGLTDILIRDMPWEHVMQPTLAGNVNVITSGAPSINPVELISTRRLKLLCESFKDCFDIVIYDNCELLGIPDASILASEMDCVLLVHNPGIAKREMALKAKSLLDKAHADILGIVFNDIKRMYFLTGDSYPRKGRNGLLRDIGGVNRRPVKPLLNQRAVEQKMGYQTSHASRPLHASDENSSFSIKVCQLDYSMEIENKKPAAGHQFLILDLELYNGSDPPFVFESHLANIYFGSRNVYGKAVSALYSDDHLENVSTHRHTNMYSPINCTLKNNFQSQEIVKSNETVLGKLIFEIPHKYEKCSLIYSASDTYIHIPLIS